MPQVICSIANIVVDVSPSLQQLFIGVEWFYKGHEGEYITSLHRVVSGLQAVRLSEDMVDPPLFFELLEPRQDNALSSVIPPWQNLGQIEIYGNCEVFGHSESEARKEGLFASAGRAVAFMPSLERCAIITGFGPWDKPREINTVEIELKRIPRRHVQVGSQDTFCLSVWGYLPSREALDIWKGSLIQRNQVLRDVRVKLSSRCTENGSWRHENWLSWEDAIELQASASLMHLGDLSLES